MRLSRKLEQLKFARMLIGDCTETTPKGCKSSDINYYVATCLQSIDDLIKLYIKG